MLSMISLAHAMPQPVPERPHAGKHKNFTEVMDELRECQWYWGGISPAVAARLLHQQPPGTFLVRDSRSAKSIFSFSYTTTAGVYHSRIYRFNGRFCLGGPNALIRSPSLRDFVEQTVARSSSVADADTSSASTDAAADSSPVTAVASSSSAPQQRAPQLRILMHPSFSDPVAQPVDIRYPLCRNRFVPTLKGACRLAIRRAMLPAGSLGTDQFPIPDKLKQYLAAHDYMLTFPI